MRREFRPDVERLEPHVLMTAVAVPVTGPSNFTPPAVNVTAITRQASALPATLALTLTTDKTAYTVGQPVRMTLTETNTGTQHVLIGDGPSVDGFYVTRNGATVWRSNAGIQPFFIRLIDLAPGQSYTLTSTWDGHPNSSFGGGELTATPTGTFVIHSQVIQSGAAANPVTITVQPPTPAPAQPLALRVTTDRASYSVGQPVTVTLTETNTSNHDVPALFGARILSGSVSGPVGATWQYQDLRAAATVLGVLHAGQSRKLTFIWDGRANLPGARVVAGAYTVSAGVDGVTGAAKFALK